MASETTEPKYVPLGEVCDWEKRWCGSWDPWKSLLQFLARKCIWIEKALILGPARWLSKHTSPPLEIRMACPRKYSFISAGCEYMFQVDCLQFKSVGDWPSMVEELSLAPGSGWATKGLCGL
jgi:hypothetical protein